MKNLLVVLILLCCVSVCGAQPPDGSTIFWHGGFMVGPIFKHTGSRLTHVAIILYKDGKPMVYEAAPPKVHKVPLDEYIQHLRDLEARPFWRRRCFCWFIVEPKKPYKASSLVSMKIYAESQMGRPYMLRGWWLNRETKGIFCSQYVGNIIEKSGRIKSRNYKESPVSLYRKLR